MKSTTGVLLAAAVIAKCILAGTAPGQAQMLFRASTEERIAPRRDLAAVTALQNAVSALGGASAIAQLTDLSVTGLIVPTQGCSIQSGSFTWAGSGLEFRSQTDGPDGRRILATGHGHPGYMQNQATHQMPAHVAPNLLPIHMPGAVLLRYLNDPLVSIEFVSDVSAQAVPGIHVRTRLLFDGSGLGLPTMEWTLDPQTFLPVQIKYSALVNIHPRIQSTNVVLLSDYRNQAGVMTPFHFVTMTNGSPEGTFQVDSARANSLTSQSDFDLLPQGAR